MTSFYPQHQGPQQKNFQKNTVHHKNVLIESTGPEGKIRGTSQQLMEKYMTLGKEALRDKDFVLAQNFFQHADHYGRLYHKNQKSFQDYRRSQQQQPSFAHGHPQHQKNQTFSSQTSSPQHHNPRGDMTLDFSVEESSFSTPEGVGNPPSFPPSQRSQGYRSSYNQNSHSQGSQNSSSPHQNPSSPHHQHSPHQRSFQKNHYPHHNNNQGYQHRSPESSMGPRKYSKPRGEFPVNNEDRVFSGDKTLTDLPPLGFREEKNLQEQKIVVAPPLHNEQHNPNNFHAADNEQMEKPIKRRRVVKKSPDAQSTDHQEKNKEKE